MRRRSILKSKEIQRRWRKLSREDIERIGNDRRRLVDAIRRTYGVSARSALVQVAEYLRRGDDDTDYYALVQLVEIIGPKALGSRFRKLRVDDLAEIGKNPRAVVDLVGERYALSPAQAARRVHKAVIGIQLDRAYPGRGRSRSMGDDDTPYPPYPALPPWMKKK